MNQDVSKYLKSLKKWRNELAALREIIIDCGLIEDFKWMHPCYTDNGKNIVLIHDFKEYAAILFPKGALLKDPEKILIQQTENTHSARQIRFTDASEIHQLTPTIKKYIQKAIEVERAGLKTKQKKLSEFETPAELLQFFEHRPDFQKAFKSLTQGRQKGYLLHFSKPKQSKTKISRIEQNIERILDGYGLNDCTCGLSKRKPNCDGSHKQLKQA